MVRSHCERSLPPLHPQHALRCTDPFRGRCLRGCSCGVLPLSCLRRPAHLSCLRRPAYLPCPRVTTTYLPCALTQFLTGAASVGAFGTLLSLRHAVLPVTLVTFKCVVRPMTRHPTQPHVIQLMPTAPLMPAWLLYPVARTRSECLPCCPHSKCLFRLAAHTRVWPR